MNTMPLEADTRILIDNNLKNLGWKFNGKEQNVWLEQPRTETERKKLGGKRPDYVLYSKNSDTPLIIIEAKKKGERIDAALQQGIQYAKELNAPLVFATDGVFCKSYHTKFDKAPLLNGDEVDEFLREVTAIKFLNDWQVNTISERVLIDRKALISIFDEANNMLRGDGLRAGIERFGEFANILFLKLISESEQIKQDSGIFSNFDTSCSWNTIKSVVPTARIEYINNMVYDKLNKYYQTNIFTPLTIRDNFILKEIMDKLDPLKLTDVDSDVKGDAFEYFLKASTASKNDLGEYFTPRHIVKTMVRLVNPQIGEKVYDPFCGTGGFLIETFNYIHNNMPRNPATEKMLREDTIYGNEITNTARITKMNMILAGDGHSNIKMKDSLANPVDGEYDIVLANMPYSQKTKHGNLYALPSGNGDSICVQHCMRAINGLSENGRMALVVPEGFLFRKDLSKTREYLLEHAQLQSIISLPQGVFLPYTGVKTNIIYATKVNQKRSTAAKRKDYWYFEVKSDGYTLDNHRRKLDTPSDLTKYEEYRKLDSDQNEELKNEMRQDMLQVGFEAIPLDKVRENSFILVGSRYREQIKQQGYKRAAIKDIAVVKIGSSAPQNLDAFQNGNYPFIRVSDLAKYGKTTNLIEVRDYVNNSAAKGMTFFEKGTIIFPKSGASCLLNHRGILGVNGYLSSHLAAIICNRDLINNKYLYYYLCYIDSKSILYNESYPSIRKEDIENILVPIPPLNVQKQIADELEGYQRVIDGAKAVVESYKPIIPENIEGDLKALEDIAIFRPSKDEVKSLANDTLVSFVPMADMNAHNINFITKKEKPISEVLTGFTYFRDNDILLAKITPCFENGKAGIARNLKNGVGFGSTEYIVIRANTDIVYPEWIYYHINSPEFLSQGKGFMTGTAGQQRVDINFVKGYSIIVPPLVEQRRILDNIKAEQALIEPSKQLIEVFTKKIQDKISEIFN